MSEFLLQEAIRQRGIHRRLNPACDQQHPEKRHQHQAGRYPAQTWPPHKTPEPERKQHQTAVLTNQQQQECGDDQLATTILEQRLHNKESQQGQPDEVVKILKRRSDHRSAQVISGGDSESKRFRQTP